MLMAASSPNNQENSNMYQPEVTASTTTVAEVLPISQEDVATIQDMNTPITWTASEYIDHARPSSWNVLWVGTALGIGAFVLLITRDLFPTIAVTIGVVLLGVYGARKPLQQTYMLDGHGLSIGNKQHPFTEFRSFTVVSDGAFMSVEFTPLKRFALYTIIYCVPSDEEKIINFLSMYLPMEESHESTTDAFMRRIHF
jgi:hypothetical protein